MYTCVNKTTCTCVNRTDSILTFHIHGAQKLVLQKSRSRCQKYLSRRTNRVWNHVFTTSKIWYHEKDAAYFALHASRKGSDHDFHVTRFRKSRLSRQPKTASRRSRKKASPPSSNVRKSPDVEYFQLLFDILHMRRTHVVRFANIFVRSPTLGPSWNDTEISIRMS